MNLPPTNHINLSVQKFGENIKALEKTATAINWKKVIRLYFIGLGIFLISIFSIIAVIRLAFKI